MFDIIYLTGFKVFGNYQANPTQLISEYFNLKKIPWLHCSVIQVTTVDADNYINLMKDQIKKHEDKKILLLHFGVGPQKPYYLQKCSYNLKNFGIPDNIGYQPINQQICVNEHHNYPIMCKLDLDSLCNKLRKQFNVEISQNPGRYLCNYIYFKSCHDISMINENYASLFVHFPSLQKVPHQQNIKFVQKLINLFHKNE